MGLQTKDSLRSLCCSYGWSYAVVWKAKSPDSMLLISGDAYHEEPIGVVVDKMLHQVHVVGEGIIGQAASTGNSKWIFSDTYFGVTRKESTVDNQAAFQDTAECGHQFISGIQTLAVISVSPQSVVQFGSTKKIPESLDFVHHVRSLFQQLQSVPGPFLSGNIQKNIDTQTYNLCGTFSSLFSSSSSISSHASIKSMHESCCKETMPKTQSSSGLAQPSNPLTSGLHGSGLQPHLLAALESSSAICASEHSGGLLQKMTPFMNNSFHVMNRFCAAGAEPQVASSSLKMQLAQALLHTNSSPPYSSGLNDSSLSAWGSEDSALTSMEQQLLSGVGIQGSQCLINMNSHTNVLGGSTSPNFHEISALPFLHGKDGPLDTITDAIANMGDEAQKLVVGQHCSSLVHVANDKHSAYRSKSSVAPIVPQLLKDSASKYTFLGGCRPMTTTSALSNPNPVNKLSAWTDPPLEPMRNGLTSLLRGDLLHAEKIGGNIFRGIPVSDLCDRPVQNSAAGSINPPSADRNEEEKSLNRPMQLAADKDLFDCLGLDPKQSQGQDCWNDLMLPEQFGSHLDSMTDVSGCMSGLDVGSMEGHDNGFFSECGLEQLLDAVVGSAKSVSKNNSDDRSSTITRAGSASVYSNQVHTAGFSSLGGSMGTLLPECKLEKAVHGCQKGASSMSLISSLIDGSYNVSAEKTLVSQPKRVEEPSKVTRKRARPGESTRPRPKDRQQIQDRVKELREIVPNGAKCSIDSLLDRTIKHMLFLQSVTKYANKLKQIDEPKMIGDENGVVLKESSTGSGGGSTWAFEVGGQTMVCPIVVEDLNPPGQMLVEMLCEERGFFLEIADIIRGFGLTILKGVMEIRDSKIWARFVVEANGEVTRMDIFLSLVKLLQQTSGISSSNQLNAVPDGGTTAFTNYQQSSSPLPISLADRLQ